MSKLRNDFDNRDDDYARDDETPALLVRPMEARDAWKMVVLLNRHQNYSQPVLDSLAQKNYFDDMIPHCLVAVKPGGKIIGFGIAPAGHPSFANKRGILKLVTDPDENQHEATHALIHGLARQMMAHGQKTVEIAIPHDDAVLQAARQDYKATLSGLIWRDEALGEIKSWIFDIDNLVKYFGHKAKPPAPKNP